MILNKKGKSGAETIIGVIVLIIILGVLIKGGVFSAIFNAFNNPTFGGYGTLLGGLFILLIIVALFKKFLEK